MEELIMHERGVAKKNWSEQTKICNLKRSTKSENLSIYRQEP